MLSPELTTNRATSQRARAVKFRCSILWDRSTSFWDRVRAKYTLRWAFLTTKQQRQHRSSHSNIYIVHRKIGDVAFKETLRGRGRWKTPINTCFYTLSDTPLGNSFAVASCQCKNTHWVHVRTSESSDSRCSNPSDCLTGRPVKINYHTICRVDSYKSERQLNSN